MLLFAALVLDFQLQVAGIVIVAVGAAGAAGNIEAVEAAGAAEADGVVAVVEETLGFALCMHLYHY